MYWICATSPGRAIGLDWFRLDSDHRQGTVHVRMWDAATVRGMLDPSTLEQSGAAPGALIFPPEERQASGRS